MSKRVWGALILVSAAIGIWMLYPGTRSTPSVTKPVTTVGLPSQGSPTLPPPAEDKKEGANEVTSKPLAVFTELHRKALKTQREMNEYRESLRDPVLLLEAVRVLKAEDAVEFSVSEQRSRLQAVEFFRAALALPNNPLRRDLLERASGIIRRDLDHHDADFIQRKSLAGDQIELFRILLRSDRELALSLYDGSEGHYYRILVSYALNMERNGS